MFHTEVSKWFLIFKRWKYRSLLLPGTVGTAAKLWEYTKHYFHVRHFEENFKIPNKVYFRIVTMLSCACLECLEHGVVLGPAVGSLQQHSLTCMTRLVRDLHSWPFKLVFRIRIRIVGGLLDPDPHLSIQIRISIQEVKSWEIKLKIVSTYKSARTKLKMQLIF